MIEMLRAAKAGDEIAFSKLVNTLGEKHARQIAFRYRNPDIDPEDIIAAYYTEVGIAIQDVKLDIGDPLRHITWQAHKRVLSFLRRFHMQNLVVDCLEPECGRTGQTLQRKNGVPCCAACGSINVRTDRRIQPIDRPRAGPDGPLPPLDHVLSAETTEQATDRLLVSAQIAEMRGYLMQRSGNPKARVVMLFDALVDHMPTDSLDIGHVITIVAKEWGTGKASVRQALRKLRVRLTEYREVFD